MKKPKFILAALLLGLLSVLNACSKKETTSPAIEYVGPIPKSEFDAVPSPTFEQLLKAYDSIITANPSLAYNDTALRIGIFNWVKVHPNGQLKTTTAFDDALKKGRRLSCAEWAFFIAGVMTEFSAYTPFGISDFIVSYGTHEPAETAARTQYPCDNDISFEDGKADAFRHAYWNILMTKRTSSIFAEVEGFAHETNCLDPNDPKAKAMDLHNNKVGRNLALQFPTSSEEEILVKLKDYKYVFTDDPTTYEASATNDQDALIYFAGKRQFDGTYKGAITNPDSGGPWDIVMSIAQCGNVISGQMAFTRDGIHAIRRFNGTLNGNSILLNFDYPYSWEQVPGMNPCNGMKATITGDEHSLSGNWTSTDCLLGGFISITQ